MATTPVTPAAQPAATTSTSILKEISSAVKLHERLIIVIISAILLFVCYIKGVTYLASRDQLNANKATAVLQAQADANAKEATDAKQMQLAYQQLAQQLAGKNQVVIAAQQQRDVDTVKQQTADKTLPPPELAARWTTLIGASPEAVQPSGSGYAATPAAATQTVIQLEAVPQLQADLAGEKQIAANESQQLNSQGSVVDTLNTQINGLNLQITDQGKACTAQVAAVKAQARKSKLHWFEIGFGLGFIAREAIKVSTGF